MKHTPKHIKILNRIMPVLGVIFAPSLLALPVYVFFFHFEARWWFRKLSKNVHQLEFDQDTKDLILLPEFKPYYLKWKEYELEVCFWDNGMIGILEGFGSSRKVFTSTFALTAKQSFSLLGKINNKVDLLAYREMYQREIEPLLKVK